MARLFYHTCQDNAGNLLFDVSGTMRLAGTGTLATIYGDEALTVPIANPMTNHPSFGSFKCFLPSGDYDFYLAKSGYTFETLTGVQGHGTMAQQDAANVAITGGTAVFTTAQAAQVGIGTTPGASGTNLAVAAGKTIWQSPSQVGINISPNYNLQVQGNVGIQVYSRSIGIHALTVVPDADSGAGVAAMFLNAALATVGSITTTPTATVYSTASDARLKTAVHTLVGELAVIRALRPVRFRWLSNDSEGVGFLAQEVAEHVQGVVTGEPDAVDEDGGIVPQMIDMSRLVPWLVGALQTLAGQVETLTERVTELETGLGG